jgi:GT2 family glycosyltransferase
MKTKKNNRGAGSTFRDDGRWIENHRAPSRAGVQCATWVCDTILLLLTHSRVSPERPLRASLIDSDGSRPHGVDAFCCEQLRTPDGDLLTTVLLVIRFPDVSPKLKGTLGIQLADERLAISLSELARCEVDLQTLLREELAGMGPEVRTDLIQFLVKALLGYNEQKYLLDRSEKLFLAREALRERLPCPVISKDQTHLLHVECMLALTERVFCAVGWLHSCDVGPLVLTAVAPEGIRVPLEGCTYFRRPDVDEFFGSCDDPEQNRGFITLFELPLPSQLTSGWLFEMQTARGRSIECSAPPLIRDLAQIRDVILRQLPLERPFNSELKTTCILPTLNKVQERWQQRLSIDTVACFGPTTASAAVSIIVPLYRRIEFLEHQLAQFVHDPQIARSDVIYVLDSPELAGGLSSLAANLYNLYRVPFRLVILKQHVGYAGANNAGASVATGRLLLLLNSDVFPEAPGWLGAMTAFYDTNSRIGALGARLLFEDDSLQHAGLYFEQMPGTTDWENLHYYKGLHRDFPPAGVVRRVPAVTAACLMVKKALYDQVGGLRGMYVQGDYEDSDLCLRLDQNGYENWYFPPAVLYHLEGQSYPSAMRALNSQYNRWLHTHLWRARIEQIMESYGSDLTLPSANGESLSPAG